ncbi:uncharacterized protein LOC121646404 isoform X2 [Melanotaenia boesemani]|uniref:uncharacterized protein LOC121646404 isoform X2 n=1 Tax=Melanotaenia boesemani TaxID=1250792 RepID=UPI001C042888|nr:uncharacterized protein LOC121646404 isoform X2 [Melanotaenia boesemani]
MMISVCLTLLCFWVAQDIASCDKTPTPVDFLTVELGDSVTLNCTYNCSSGFVHGYWSTASNNSDCTEISRNGTFCTVAVCLSVVSAEDVKENYTCYTEDREHPQLLQKTERIISLQVRRKIPHWTVAPKTDTKNVSFSAETKHSSGGEFTGIKVLATVTVTVAMVLAGLAVYLCVNRNRQNWNGESGVSRSCLPQPPNVPLLPLKGTPSIQSERVTVRIPPPDNESETEVPYADIMITVRGVSTPELTQVGYLATGERRGDESRAHLQASRSADRLHVPQPREVSRKMSTNSEYAVITYA